ncbi:MAG: hypothetical protein JWN78_2156 [Bacteroidota bacterium]|nr:hypothetical protein [Bacteroidota bacterium]
MKKRNWINIILWWEVRRIPYNIFMIVVAYLSIYISDATIPLNYKIIALILNIIYTLNWLVEIIVNKQSSSLTLNRNYKYFAFCAYLIISIIFVIGIAIYYSIKANNH